MGFALDMVTVDSYTTQTYMCMFIVWYPLEFSRLHNLHLWYWNSLLQSLISSGEDSTFAHFAAAIANHYNLAFSFHQVPITAGWTEAAWYERLAQYLYTWPTVWLNHGHPSKYRPGSALLNFSDLTGTGYHSAMCYPLPQHICVK